MPNGTDIPAAPLQFGRCEQLKDPTLVPEVAPYLLRASVSVVPICFGGGTRFKILEAVAHGLPVVSTTVGAEGLDLDAEKHLLVANSPSAFADACIRVL